MINYTKYRKCLRYSSHKKNGTLNGAVFQSIFSFYRFMSRRLLKPGNCPLLPGSTEHCSPLPLLLRYCHRPFQTRLDTGKRRLHNQCRCRHQLWPSFFLLGDNDMRSILRAGAMSTHTRFDFGGTEVTDVLDKQINNYIYNICLIICAKNSRKPKISPFLNLKRE